MKKILILIVVTFTLLGCKNNSNKSDQNSDLEQAIAKAEMSERVETKLFLGFELGMTKEEAQKHFDKLIQEEKVYTDGKGFYYCEVTTSMDNTYHLNFRLQYDDDDKLYKINLPFKNITFTSGFSTDFYFLSTLFYSEDRGYFEEYEVRDYNGDLSEKIFIKDNLIVAFENVSNTIQYIDAPTEKKLKLQEKKEKQEKREKSSSYF